jgi:hypothetical protein
MLSAANLGRNNVRFGALLKVRRARAGRQHHEQGAIDVASTVRYRHDQGHEGDEVSRGQEGA